MIRSAVVALVLVVLLASAASANLLTNGDFEAGNISGWTVWHSGWSSGYAAAASTDAKYSGDYGLKLNITGNASFGVYQQVTVTPGTTYRLDGQWKGMNGTGNWFEVLLIDGVITMDQADNPSYCFDNVVAGYDGNSAYNHPPAMTFGWEAFADTYAFEVSPYIHNGQRTATGSVMTVVLKTGSNYNTIKPTTYFDNVSLEAVPEPSGLLGLASALGLMVGLRRKR